MKYKILFSVMFAFIFLTSFVNASGDYSQGFLGTFKEDQHVRLIQGQQGATSINITEVISPSGEVIVSNVEMEQNNSNGNFFYILNNSLIDERGIYTVTGQSDKHPFLFIYDFEIERNISAVGIFGIDIMNPIILVILAILFTGAVLLFIYGLVLFSSLIVIVIGFILMLNEINFVVSLIVILVGVVIAFMGGKNEKD